MGVSGKSIPPPGRWITIAFAGAGDQALAQLITTAYAHSRVLPEWLRQFAGQKRGQFGSMILGCTDCRTELQCWMRMKIFSICRNLRPRNSRDSSSALTGVDSVSTMVVSTPGQSAPMRTPALQERRNRQILADVVRTYIETGEPVSSRAISARFEETISTATIRNVMGELEDGGFLYQPHTSAGRVPTAAAYGFFAQEIATQATLSIGR